MKKLKKICIFSISEIFSQNMSPSKSPARRASSDHEESTTSTKPTLNPGIKKTTF